MPIDWDAFERDVDSALDNAEERTDEALASRISSVTRLTDEEIVTMFPEPADVERLKRLMVIVKSAGDRNQKTARIADEIGDLSGVVLTLLQRLV